MPDGKAARPHFSRTDNMTKKSAAGFFALLFACLSAFSLPGTQQYLSDVSGEYVFYRDKSFRTESVVGFLFYNENAYAARYYAPAEKKSGRAEKDIAIYVSVNPQAGTMELTGEKIQGAVSPEDADIVNYLHDLLYEFAARRKKVRLDSPEKISLEQDFPQFGGNVTILFNPFVPIFNIESIESADGKKIFTIETSGMLSSSSDASFSAFKGIDGLPKDKKRTFKNRAAAEVTAEFGAQSVTLDSQWKQAMENLWLLGDYAILSMTTLNIPEGTGNLKTAKDSLVRRLSQSATLSYAVWQQRKITEEKNQTSIMNVFYQPESENTTRDFKVITDNQDGTFSLLTLTVFDSVYQKNRPYFSAILKSYTAGR